MIGVASAPMPHKPMREAVLEGWTESEQSIARQAFDQAYARSIEQLVQAVRSRMESLRSAESVWALHDFLSIERHTIEGRFDFRPEGILFVFASLVKDNLLQLDELAGLDAEKLSKITAMARF
jgi:hypothetical protein